MPTRIISPVLSNEWFWIGLFAAAVFVALLVHLAFFSAWPDHFIHEDSAPYLDQAKLILDGQLESEKSHRPYGVGLFLAALSRLIAPSVVVFVLAQHLLSIASALLIAASLRLAGVGWAFAILAFCLLALSPRLIHYDNAIGAETLSVFMVSAAGFVATGMALRGWRVWPCAVLIGLFLGYALFARSAMISALAAMLLWILLPLNSPFLGRWRRRFGIVAVVATMALALPVAAAIWNHLHYDTSDASTEASAAMLFVVGYSGNFEDGIQLEKKAMVRDLVKANRAAIGPEGWYDSIKGNDYQWPTRIVPELLGADDSLGDVKKVFSDIFWETVTTPATLWRHLSVHVWREMRFLLTDAGAVARLTPNPQAYEYFVKRDVFPFFGSPTRLQPHRIAADLLPEGLGIRAQSILTTLYSWGLAPRPREDLLLYGLQLPISVYASVALRIALPVAIISALAVLCFPLAGMGAIVERRAAARRPTVAAPWRAMCSSAALMTGLWLANGLIVTFMVYGLNRYGYYIIPYLVASAAISLNAVWTFVASRFVSPGVALGQ